MKPSSSFSPHENAFPPPDMSQRESSIIDNINTIEYSSLLQEANSSSYPELENSQCLQIGYDHLTTQTIILFIPELALHKPHPSSPASTPSISLQIHRLVLYFLKVVQHIVLSKYILIYAHTPLSILSQHTLIQQFHKILPISHRKNLSKLVILHPTFIIKFFFETAGMWFLSKKFYRKLSFYDSIHEFQLQCPSYAIHFPSHFHRNEDQLLGFKLPETLPALRNSFVKSLGTTKFMFLCVSYLREVKGYKSKGFFRLAGDRVMEELVKTRLAALPNHWESYIVIGDAQQEGKRQNPPKEQEWEVVPASGRDLKESSEENSSPIASHHSRSSSATKFPPVNSRQPAAAHQRSSSLPPFPINFSTPAAASSPPLPIPNPPVLISPLSKIYITDINSIGGALKMSVRDLPEPLISYSHYDYLTTITRQMESGKLERRIWEEQVNQAIGSLPPENCATLNFLLK
jgi:hypothetical protein